MNNSDVKSMDCNPPYSIDNNVFETRANPVVNRQNNCERANKSATNNIRIRGKYTK